MSILSKRSLASAVAAAFLAGKPGLDAIVERATQTLGRPWRWLLPLARRYEKAFAKQARPRHRAVVRFLLEDRGFTRARSKYFTELSVVQRIVGPQPMQPIRAARNWNVPAIESVESLAEWFHLDPRDLLWLADPKELTRKNSSPRLRHCYYCVLAKASGGIRLIEAPKKRLKQMQRQILTRILDGIPSHPAAHGFVPGRSIRTFVAPHVG